MKNSKGVKSLTELSPPADMPADQLKHWNHLFHGIRHPGETSKEWVDRRNLAKQLEDRLIQRAVDEQLQKVVEAGTLPVSVKLD